jgi:hypothetical protein
MTVFWPKKALSVAVNSAFPMLVRGQAGSFEGELIVLLLNWATKGDGSVIGERRRLYLKVQRKAARQLSSKHKSIKPQ